MEREPSSLQEAIIYFANPANCHDYLVARRWPDGVTCPTCGCKEVRFLTNQNRWWCPNEHAKRQFSLKTGTIYEESPLGLDKWLTATWLITNCKNGVSSCEIARALNITQKSAWFMDHRIRVSFGLDTPDKMTGHVEADETFIGGKSRNMHASKRARRITGTGGHDKVPVMGILERGNDGKNSKVVTAVISNRKKSAIHAEVRKHVEAGSALYSDALKSYNGLEREYAHQVIDHAVAYVDGNVHTNSLENFWSLLKRSISGTYVSVEPFHLFRYLDEQAYRFNQRHLTDAERFDIAVRGVVGKRLTFDQLTGKADDRNEAELRR
ncbi:MAG: IS1595 family transposase [Bryobacteraceae bacterium]|jgi:transposase-like protein